MSSHVWGDPVLWVVFAVALAFLLTFKWARRALLRRRWLALGDALGFRAVENRLAKYQEGPTLAGSYLGRETNLFLYHTGSGKSRHGFTGAEMEAHGADPGFHLRLSKEDFVSWVQKKLGGQDVEVGDPAFDKAFRIESSSPARARLVLHDPRVREALLARKRLVALDVKDKRVYYIERGYQKKREYFEGVLPPLHEVTEAVERAAPQAEPALPHDGRTRST